MSCYICLPPPLFTCFVVALVSSLLRLCLSLHFCCCCFLCSWYLRSLPYLVISIALVLSSSHSCYLCPPFAYLLFHCAIVVLVVLLLSLLVASSLCSSHLCPPLLTYFTVALVPSLLCYCYPALVASLLRCSPIPPCAYYYLPCPSSPCPYLA